MFRAPLLALVGLVVLAPSASGAYNTATPPLPAPAPNVVYDSCPDTPDAFGCYLASANTIWIVGNDRFNLAHEMGHAFDSSNLDNGERTKFTRLAKMQGPWNTGTGLTGGKSPSERFADAYAACRLKLDPNHSWQTSYGYSPTRKQHRRICAFIKRAAD